MSSFENSPHLSSSIKRKNIPDGLWNRCEVCGEITFSKELDRNFKICPKCDYHYPMSASERMRMLIASKNFIEYESSIKIPSAAFVTSLKEHGGEADVTSELVMAGEARLHEYQIMLCIINATDGLNIQFNLNKTEYEKILYTFNKALMKSLPLLTFYADGTIVNLSSKYTATLIYEGGHIEPNDHKTKSMSPPSGGGVGGVSEANTTTKGKKVSAEWLSFIALINLAAIVEKLSQQRIPHITVLTNPRVGSEFSTSFPLGDIVLAEPKYKNLKSTDNRKNNPKTKLLVNDITKNVLASQLSPENYLIDRYVNRRDLKKNLTKILSFCIE
ncbi:hypothetical protein FJZ31_38605 [Candidatus Poribacteria bacterium]|nr:hypothetical protein [Candidatus Poribacteria bacterium]